MAFTARRLTARAVELVGGTVVVFAFMFAITNPFPPFPPTIDGHVPAYRIDYAPGGRADVLTRWAGAGTRVSSTAYCATGTMANGHRTHVGAVAGVRFGHGGPYFPMGARVRVSDSPWGPGVFTVEDRIGHGSQLDFAMPGDCRGARRWGRHPVTVVRVG